MKYAKLQNILLLFVLFACSSSAYQYYTVDVRAVSDISNGRLLAAESKDDLPLSYCLPRAGVASPCIMTKKEIFFRAMRDLETLKTQLKDCQRSR